MIFHLEIVLQLLLFVYFLIQLEQKKPTYGKRKLLNNSLIMAIFSLIKKEVEAKNSLEVKELLEEMQSMTAEEKRRITRKQSVPEEDDLTTDDRVEKVLDLFANESAVEKSKVAKIFKQKNNAVTLAIRKNPIKQKLLSMGVSKTKAKMDFPGPNFTCGGKYFTKDDSTTGIGRG